MNINNSEIQEISSICLRGKELLGYCYWTSTSQIDIYELDSEKR